MNAKEMTRILITRILVSYGQLVVRAVHTGDIYASQPQVDMIEQLEKIATGTSEQLFGTMQLVDTAVQKPDEAPDAPPKPEDDRTGEGMQSGTIIQEETVPQLIADAYGPPIPAPKPPFHPRPIKGGHK
jgi:hypothetical protein